jgi:hypothetical protein
MAVTLPLVWQVEFDSLVKQAYQKGGMLRPYVRIKDNVVGKSTRFRRLGRGVAVPRLSGALRTPMGVQFSDVVATLNAWEALEWSDMIDTSMVNFDETRLLAEAVGLAAGRRMDQIVVDAMTAGFASATIAAGGTGLTDAKLRQTKRLFEERAVPPEDRFIIMSPKAADDVLGEQRHSGVEYGAGSTVRTGTLPPIYGMQPVIMETRTEGGLPFAGSVRQCYAWDRQSIGLAISQENAVDIEWNPANRVWQIVQEFNAGAVVIDGEGVIRIDIAET